MRERDVILLWFMTIAVPMDDAVSIPSDRIKSNLCLALLFEGRFQLVQEGLVLFFGVCFHEGDC